MWQNLGIFQNGCITARISRFFFSFTLVLLMCIPPAHSAGYTCDTSKVYSSCNTNYYLDNEKCLSCPPGCKCPGGTTPPQCNVTVTFDLAGGDWGGTSKTQTVAVGESLYVVYDTFPSKAGYTFGGFYTGQNCTGTQYFGEKNNSYYNLVSLLPFGSDTALHACWKTCPAGSYCPGGGMYIYEDQVKTCPAGTSVAGSDSVDDCKVTVTFKSGNTTLGTQQVAYNTATMLTSEAAFTAPVSSTYGWMFDGWAEAPNASVKYGDLYTVTLTSDITLYGVWRRGVSFVYYDGASATSTTTGRRTQYYQNTSATAAAAGWVGTYPLTTQTTYNWAPVGWVLNSTTSTITASTATTTDLVAPAADAAATYYALYKRTATVAYDGNGNTGGSTANTTGTQYYNAGGSGALPLNVTLAQNGFTKTGYTFDDWDGWYMGGSSFTFPNTAWTSSSTYSLAAEWYANCNTITLNNTAHSGSGGTTTISKFTDSTIYYSGSTCTGTPITSVTTPTKTNATYAGTYTTSATSGGTQCISATGALSTSTSCNVTGATMWYARYTCSANYAGAGTTTTGACAATKYSVTINKNSGSGTLTVNGTTATGTTNVTFTCSYGDTFTMPAWSSASGTANNMTRSGMVFTGWSATGTISCDSAKTVNATWVTPTCSAGTGVNTASLNSVSGNAPVCNRSSKDGYYCSATQTGTAGATSLTTTCTAAGDGYYAKAGATDQTACAQGSYSAKSSASSSCVACPAGRTTSGTGPNKYNATANTACATTCSNATGVNAWATPSWSANTVANLCAVDTCSASYYKNSNACSPCTDLGAIYTESYAGASKETQCFALTTPGRYVRAEGDQLFTWCAWGDYCPGDIPVYFGQAGGNIPCASVAGGLYTESEQRTDSPESCFAIIPAGKYIAKSTDSATTECTSGYYCPGLERIDYGDGTAVNQGRNSCATDTNNRYPNSDAGATAMTLCYSNTKQRAMTSCTQKACSNPDTTGCASVTCASSCACTGTACDYVAYSNSAGTSDGTIKSGCSTNVQSCTKDVASLTAKAGNYVNGTTNCPLCSSLAGGLYPNSNAGNSGGTSACFTDSLSGKVIATANATTTTDCKPGYYKPAHTVNYGSTSSCSACTGATYAANTGQASCTECPPAVAYPGSVLGYYWDTTGLHVTDQGCHATIVNPTISNGSLSSSICYLDKNGDYGTADALRGSWGCEVRSSELKCDGGYYTTKTSTHFAYRSLQELATNVCVEVGAGYWSADDALTRTACATGLTTIGYGTGANEADDCGRILHAGDNQIYLRSAARTSPALNVKVGNQTFFGALSTTYSSALKVKNGSTTYSVVNDWQ